jgi:hypothetical protein
MRLRLSLVSAALFLGALPVAVTTPAACAAGPQGAQSAHAALVVDTGESDVALCVELPDGSVNGIELIKLAGEQHGLQYTLGYGGKAVCKLAGVGPEGDDCFSDYPNFWGYWRGDGDGGWTWSSTGAGATTVEPGDVEGWSWGSGQDGSTHPQPPATTIEMACGVPAEDEGEDEPSEASMKDDAGDGRGSGGGSKTSERSTTGGSDPTEPEARERSDPKDGTRPEPRERSANGPEEEEVIEQVEPTPEAEPHVALVSGSDDTEDPGPPVVGLVGLGLAIGLGITAAALTAGRKRKRT